MGFLDIGTPLSWAESEAVRDYVKSHGISQLLNMWRANRDRSDPPEDLRWGDELEYILVHMGGNHSEGSRASLHLDATSIIAQLNEHESHQEGKTSWIKHKWLPEFASYMVEATPGEPYSLSLNSLLDMERNMLYRRLKLQASLPPSTYVTSLTAFPRLGLPDGYTKGVVPRPQDSKSKSVFIPDAVINPHPRFGTLVQNICSRRKAKPFIQIPLAEDAFTYSGGSNRGGSQEQGNNEKSGVGSESLWQQGDNVSAQEFWEHSLEAGRVDRFVAQEVAEHVTLNPVRGSIYMDCFAFGMGMSCVQTTFGAPTIAAARYLYDQLLVLAPLFLALTASTPCLRGLLADTDTRWATLEQAVDCRTEEEEKGGSIPKSRYSGASLYLSVPFENSSRYWSLNDSKAPLNDEVRRRLVGEGMDEALARHYAHLWVRDPMVIFSEKIREVDDQTMGDHFENIQSTNWNSVRFKPPPLFRSTPLPSSDSTCSSSQQSEPPASSRQQPHPTIPWRVEFRTPEIQLTEFENAAQVACISVLVQILLQNYEAKRSGREEVADRRNMARLLQDLYIPMTLNDVNMKRSWNRDAVTKEKFFFPNIYDHGERGTVLELNLRDIFMGTGSGRPGLLGIAREFIEQQIRLGKCDAAVRKQFRRYADLIAGKVSGELLTTAQYLRRFITAHPTYKNDSRVSIEACHDVSVLATNLGLGVWTAPELTGVEAARRTVNVVQTDDFTKQRRLFLKTTTTSQQPFRLPSFSPPTRTQVARLAKVLSKSPCTLLATEPCSAAVAGLGRVTDWDVVSTEDFTYHCMKKDQASHHRLIIRSTPNLGGAADPSACRCRRDPIYVPSLRNKESFCTRFHPFSSEQRRRRLPSENQQQHSASAVSIGGPPSRRRVNGTCSCEASREDLEYYAQVCEASA